MMSVTAESFPNAVTQRIVIVTMIAAVYGISLANGFVWDDHAYLLGNPVYSEFSLRGIFLSLANGVEYLPLRDLTYALDYLFWGERPFGFHLTNLLLFTLNVLLVHRFAALAGRKLANLAGRNSSNLFPFVVATGFALHPINAEAVNFITCRNVLVSGVFVFLSAICMLRYLEENSRKLLLASLCAFLCALLGKATAIMLPILFLFFFPVLFPGQWRRIAVVLIPFFVVAAGFFLFFKQLADQAGFTDVGHVPFNFWSKTALALQIPFFYLQKLLIPSGFAAAYSTSFADSFLSVRVFTGLAGVVLLAVTAIVLRRRLPEIAAGTLWFIAALLPVLNFFSTHPLVADRYAYLPTCGFLLVVAAGVEQIQAARMRIIVVTVLCVILGGLSFSRSLDWRSDLTLWQDNVRKFPLNTDAHLNLAHALFREGEHQKALDLLRQNSTVPWLNLYHSYYLGVHYYKMGDYAKAKEEFLKPLNVAPGFIGPLYYLGLMAEKERDYVAAAQYYNKAVVSRESDSLGHLPLVKKRLAEVSSTGLAVQLEALRQRLSANPPDLAARRDLAMTLDRLGFYTEAVQHYLAIEKSGYKGWPIYQNIANCYFNLNNAAESIRYYEKVIQLGGVTEDTLTNIGIAYRKTGQYDRSIASLEQGSRLFPGSPYPLFNLAVTYFAAGRKDAARSTFLLVEKNFPDYKDRIAPYLQNIH